MDRIGSPLVQGGTPAERGRRRMPDGEFIDLEIALHGGVEHSYGLELRCLEPRSTTPREVGLNAPIEVHIDPLQLRLELSEMEGYGQLLWNSLFRERPAAALLDSARAITERERLPLRLRLFVSPSAWRLHDVRWEALTNPD